MSDGGAEGCVGNVAGEGAISGVVDGLLAAAETGVDDAVDVDVRGLALTLDSAAVDSAAKCLLLS